MANSSAEESTSFLRADANADFQVNLSDAVFILKYLFLSGMAPTCEKAADANDARRSVLPSSLPLRFEMRLRSGTMPRSGLDLPDPSGGSLNRHRPESRHS